MSVMVAVGPSGSTVRPVPETLEFVAAPPGMMALRRFRLDALDDAGALFALRSTEDAGVRLFVIPPQVYVPEYAPVIDAGTRAALGLADADPVLLVVVHPGEDGAPPTANLLAPVAVNPETGAALQVVLDEEWPLRAPLGVAA
ncbi:MAG: flagellar assembly protein FliW [Actinomycetales bacterium]|jgi:flagellar assembly factor FliW|nr:flagellar assembly protein FliW [Actinomycetales bacterium]